VEKLPCQLSECKIMPGVICHSHMVGVTTKRLEVVVAEQHAGVNVNEIKPMNLS